MDKPMAQYIHGRNPAGEEGPEGGPGPYPDGRATRGAVLDPSRLPAFFRCLTRVSMTKTLSEPFTGHFNFRPMSAK